MVLRPTQSKLAKLYRLAVRDFFGVMDIINSKMANRIVVFLTRPSKNIQLTEEEKDALWYVRKNLDAGVYR